WQTADGKTITAENIGTIQTETILHAVFNEIAVPYVAQVGSTKYITLEEAISAITGDTGTGTGTVQVLSDAPFTRAYIPAERNVTLDLNGYTITSAYAEGEIITNRGTFTVKSTGKQGTICWTGTGTTPVLYSDANMTVDNVKVIGGTSIYNKGTTCSITNCTLLPDMTVTAPLSVWNDMGGKIALIENCICADKIINADGRIEKISKVKIGTQTAKAQMGIQNDGGSGQYIGTIADCEIWATTHGILNRGNTQEPSSIIGNIVNCKVSSDGETYSALPGYAGGAVTNYNFGKIHITSGRFLGAVQKFNSYDITYPASCRLSTTPDSEGFYFVEKYIQAVPTVAAGTATATAPDVALGDGKTILDATTADQTVLKTVLTLGATTVSSMDAAEKLEICTNQAVLTFSAPALTAIKAGAASAAVTLTLAEAAASTVPGAKKVITAALTTGENTPVAFSAATLSTAAPAADFPLAVFAVASDGAKTKLASTQADGKLTFPITGAGTYAVMEQPPVMTLATSDTHKNPGDTIAVNVIATATAAQAYKSFVFTPVCPANLTLTAVTTALPEYTAVNT
ncbi:MAG: hypothetical protein RSB55_08775, partial [Oscillospiraceae bacterium]